VEIPLKEPAFKGDIVYVLATGPGNPDLPPEKPANPPIEPEQPPEDRPGSPRKPRSAPVKTPRRPRPEPVTIEDIWDLMEDAQNIADKIGDVPADDYPGLAPPDDFPQDGGDKEKGSGPGG
jgi:hypothetical protein